MKKKYYIIALLVSMANSVDAQIQRNFGGIILGETTLHQAQDILEKKGMEVFVREDDDSVFKIENYLFEGTIWSTAVFFFNNDKLNNVYLSETEENTPRKDIEARWKKLHNTFTTKYRGVMVENVSNDEELLFEDGKSRLLASYMDYGEYVGIALFYTDKSQLREEYKADIQNE